MKESEGKDTYRRCMISRTMKKLLDWGSETSDLDSGTETELNKLIRNYARELNKIAKCRHVKQRYTKGHTKEWNQPLQLNEERIKKRQKKLQSGRNICI